MTNKTFKRIMFLITYAVGLFLIVGNIGQVVDGIGNIFAILSPVLIAICIAFVLNLILNLYEKKLFSKLWIKFPKVSRFKRGICVALTYLTLVAFLAAFTSIIGPQIASSAKSFVSMLPQYAKIIQEYINDIAVRFNIESFISNENIENWTDVFSQIASLAGTSFSKIIDLAVGLTNGVVNFFLSIIFSVYILAKKEKLIGILKKILYAVAPKKYADIIYNFASDSSDVFSRFVGGQLTEALILGSLCCIGMLIFNLPYAPLISLLIGIMSLIPVLGAYISTIPSAIIIALESPTKAIIFVVFIIVLQQIEGNLIYPKVVGSAIGLDGFWVLLSITIGGSLFGVAGMLLAVPSMAILYSLVRNIVNYISKRKNKAEKEIGENADE